MKKLSTYLLGLLLLVHAALAQTTDPVRQKLDNIFAPPALLPVGPLLQKQRAYLIIGEITDLCLLLSAASIGSRMQLNRANDAKGRIAATRHGR